MKRQLRFAAALLASCGLVAFCYWPPTQWFPECENLDRAWQLHHPFFLQAYDGTNLHAADLLKQASNNLKHAPPFTVGINFSCDMFGLTMNAQGRYWQLGPSQARMELQATDARNAWRIIHVSDGKHFWNTVCDGSHRQVAFADLERLGAQVPGRSADADSSTDYAARIGVGSLTFLMHNLAGLLEFQSPLETSLDGVDVIVLRGRWRPDSLERLLQNQQLGEPPSQKGGGALPRQLPDGVEIVLRARSSPQLLPCRIAYYKTATRGNSPEMQRFMTLEFSDAEPVQELPETFESVALNDSELLEATDATGQYLRLARQPEYESPSELETKSRVHHRDDAFR